MQMLSYHIVKFLEASMMSEGATLGLCGALSTSMLVVRHIFVNAIFVVLENGGNRETPQQSCIYLLGISVGKALFNL